MRFAFALLPLSGLIAACGALPEPRKDAFTADGQVIAMSGGRGGPANACFACHGLSGEGDGQSAPRLAGLSAGYMQKQLDDYASGLRKDASMQAATRWLSHEDRRAVATYYAALTPPPADRRAAPPPSIWLRGDPARGLIACATCHGDDGRGVGPGSPSLAGQPAAYHLDQMERWRTGARRNDPRGIMSVAIARLTESEARAIAVWSERQPASPKPYSDAARLSAAAAAAEQLAASRGTRRPGR